MHRFERTKRKLGMAIYLLPNLFTTANMFCGFFAIIRSIEGRYLQAATAILVGSIFDVLDGRIARLTKTTSEFGLQYDSLADIITFCLAPSILMFTMALGQYGRIGWILCFLYFVCGALRLARFNVQTKKMKDPNFVGLPSPLAALTVGTFIIFYFESKVLASTVNIAFLQSFFLAASSEATLQVFLFQAAPVLGLLMVSPIKYLSFKDFKLKNTRPFYILVVLIFFFVIIVSQFEIFAFLLVLSYILSGPIGYMLSPNYRRFNTDIGDDEHDFGLVDDYESSQIHQDEAVLHDAVKQDD